jgi:SAM-dependent methyltransferase
VSQAQGQVGGAAPGGADAVAPGAVTVVITTYDHAHFLGDALDSVLAQGEAVDEVLVVDDGSHDDPETVVARYPDVRLHRQVNQGLSAARNTGLALCRTEYVTFLDADDLLLPGGLAASRRLAETRPAAGLVYGAHTVVDATLQLVGDDEVVQAGDDPYRLLLTRNVIGMHGTVLYRREALLAVGGFDPALPACEDYDVYLKVARSSPVVSHGVPVAAYRLHEGNMSRDGTLMLRTLVSVLSRQRSTVRYHRARREALHAGVRQTWRAYGSSSANWRTRLYGHASQSQSRVATLGELLRMVVLFPGVVRAPARTQAAKVLPAVRPVAVHPRVGRVRLGSLDRLTPISSEFGYDRGQPIDRTYIADFLSGHRSDVRGAVLEVGDDGYTREFGDGQVTSSDVLHVHDRNPQATYVDDLTDGRTLPSDAFDCVILTQVLQMIYDAPAALRTAQRILKPGGVLLLTVPGISQVAADEWSGTWYWGFTSLAVRRMVQDAFGVAEPEVRTYGNVLTAVAFLHGLAAEDLPAHRLTPVDPYYQLIIAARVVKPAAGS